MNFSGLFKPDIFLQIGHPHDMTNLWLTEMMSKLRESEPTRGHLIWPPNGSRNIPNSSGKLNFFEAQLRMAIGFTMITMKWKAFPARKRGRTSPVHSRLNLQSLELRRAQGAPRLQPKICRKGQPSLWGFSIKNSFFLTMFKSTT
jgi:hypothetical protein